MLYFSEIYKKKIITPDGVRVGVLEDLIFTVNKDPLITKLVVVKSPFTSRLFDELHPQQQTIIPISSLQKINPHRIIVKNNFEKDTIEENELFVRKNLLDTQVIDIEGNNVVRVNDVLIDQREEKTLKIYGVDIGLAGMLRWFRMEGIASNLLRIFKKTLPQTTLAWSDTQPLELSRGRVKVNFRFNALKNLHPSDLADYLETQNFRNSLTLLQSIDKEYVAQVISELQPNFQLGLLKRMSIDKVALILSSMDPDDAVDVLTNFSHTRRQEILKKMNASEENNLRKLLKLTSTSLGKFLNSDYLTVYPEELTSEVLRKIKDVTVDFSILEYIYVVNKEKQLVGVFNLHEFLLQNMYTPVYRFMKQNVVAANLNTPVEIAFRRMIKYKIASLPVIDNKKRIIGIVSIDDVGEEVVANYKGEEQ